MTLTELIAAIEAGPVTRELNDGVIRECCELYASEDGDHFYRKRGTTEWIKDDGRLEPLSNLQDATLAVPEGLTFQLGPGLNGGRLALVDEPEWFYRSSNPRPCLATAEAPEDAPALVLAGLKAREREAEG